MEVYVRITRHPMSELSKKSIAYEIFSTLIFLGDINKFYDYRLHKLIDEWTVFDLAHDVLVMLKKEFERQNSSTC